jgi:hypothetical protein
MRRDIALDLSGAAADTGAGYADVAFPVTAATAETAEDAGCGDGGNVDACWTTSGCFGG